ncbi:MAG: cell division protein ZapA [bacterium]
MNVGTEYRVPGEPFQWVVKRSVEVNIDGKLIPLRSEYEQAYLDELASFVEERYKEVRTSRGNPYSQAVLAALNIADELFKERDRNQTLQEGVRKRCQRIQDLVREIDPVGGQKRGKGRRG